MKKYYLFSSYFDVFANIVGGLFILVENVSYDERGLAISPSAAIYLGAWGVLCYLWLVFITNRGRPISSVFAVPVKMLLTAVFFLSSAGVISAIFKKDVPIAERAAKGIISALFFCLARKTIKSVDVGAGFEKTNPRR